MYSKLAKYGLPLRCFTVTTAHQVTLLGFATISCKKGSSYRWLAVVSPRAAVLIVALSLMSSCWLMYLYLSSFEVTIKASGSETIVLLD